MAVLSVGMKKAVGRPGYPPYLWNFSSALPVKVCNQLREKETLMCGFCDFYAHHGGFQAVAMLPWAGARKPQVQHTLQNGARQLQHPLRYLELFPIVFIHVYQQCSSFQ